MPQIIIRKALPMEAEYLTELALRSKQSWGYSEEFIALCRDELAVRETKLVGNRFHCYVAVCNEIMYGFYILEQIEKYICELDALYIEPAKKYCGIGTKLFNHAKQLGNSNKNTKMLIQSDPFAEKFYLSMGAQLIGEKESASITGRYLPLFSVPLID